MPDTQVGSVLTDGTGVSSITLQKLIKDFVVDVLTTGAAAIVAAGVANVDQAVAQPMVVATAVAGAVIGALYRIVLRWASS